MKVCNFDPVKLMDYITGEGSRDTQEEVELHLDNCSYCRSEVEELRKTQAVLQQWQVPGPRVQLVFVPQKLAIHQRVMEWLKSPAAVIPHWAYGFAAVLLLVIAAASFVNMDIQFGTEGIRIQTGLFDNSTSASGPENKQLAVKEPDTSRGNGFRQDEIITRVNSLLDDRDTKLRAEYQLLLADIIKNMQFQHLDDMEQISKTVAERQNELENQLRQRDEILKGIIKVSQSGR